MSDQTMYKLLELQNELNSYLKTNFRMTNKDSDETFKQIFFDYTVMLKNSIFRAEVNIIARECFNCNQKVMRNFCEIDCVHLICDVCISDKKFYSTFETFENFIIFKCICSRVTKKSDIKYFGVQ